MFFFLEVHWNIDLDSFSLHYFYSLDNFNTEHSIPKVMVCGAANGMKRGIQIAQN